MRVSMGRRRSRSVLLAAAAGLALACAALALLAVRGSSGGGKSGGTASGTLVAATPDRGGGIDPDTRTDLGTFRLPNGRTLDLFTGRTVDGRTCVVDEDATGASGGACVQGDLFDGRRIVFSVGSEGAPDQLSELHVSGIVAPSVRSAELVTTDGSGISLDLTPKRAFLWESPTEQLRAHVYPTAIRLYGANRRLLETVSFPSAE